MYTQLLTAEIAALSWSAANLILAHIVFLLFSLSVFSRVLTIDSSVNSHAQQRMLMYLKIQESIN